LSLKKKKWIGLVIVLTIVFVTFTSSFQSIVNVPKELRMLSSSIQEFDFSLPITASVSTTNADVLEVNGSQTSFTTDLSQPIKVKSKQEGKSNVTFKLFGVIPFKTVSVHVLKDVKVIPGGQTIGVKLKSAGIMVVGHHSIKLEDGTFVSPAEKAGLRIGDLIVKMDGERVSDVKDVVNKVNQSGQLKKQVTLDIIRNKKPMEVQVEPVYDPKAKVYRLGLYIRDSAAGVGTLTFYDPKNHFYGALGHVITDIDTQKPIVVENGKILYSNVTSIDKGMNGKPGGKRAVFVDENDVVGNITKNTPFGIFGEMIKKPKNGLINKPLPIALPEEVKEGPAEILTVIEGQKVERFQIQIVHVVHQKYPATKGMIIKVIDPKLLEKTGGIIQGMSGSPIIQEGKLVGAVTHVFVNDPTSGYGSFIEWMIRDAGILKDERNQDLKAS